MASLGEVPSHRACAHCRSQKVRCIPSVGNVDICERCARTGRPCVFTPLQKRKQRKRTDTRVAELEREMRAMRSALKQREEAASGRNSSPDVDDGQQRGLWVNQSSGEARRLDQDVIEEAPTLVKALATSNPLLQMNIGTGGGPALWPTTYADRPPPTNTEDVIDRGKISLEMARKLFEAYRTDLCPLYPMVPIPDNVTADDMRRSRPALFLAIIAAAAAREEAELSAILDQEVLQAYATRSLVQSEKSLELVQALLISSMWYHPPQKFGQLKYYEYVHMAATMAMDIGIGSRPSSHRANQRAWSNTKVEDRSLTTLQHDPPRRTDDLESRRTFLACYFICAGVALSLRRPNMLRVNSYIRECVVYLDQAPDALPTDRMIVAWVQLIMIGEEINAAFCYDDPGNMASLADLRTQMMMKDFERRLSEWYNGFPDVHTGQNTLGIMYYTLQLYLHEIALHVDHSPEDFCAPYQMGLVQHFPQADAVPSQLLAETVAGCITNAHSLLNVFLEMDPNVLRAAPVFTFVRVSFAAFVLAKLCQSAATRGSRIGQVLDRSMLRTESYMDRLILHVRDVVGPRRCRVPAIFLALLFKLRQWCLHPERIADAEREQPIYTAQQDLTSPGVDDHPRLIEQLSSTDSSPHATSQPFSSQQATPASNEPALPQQAPGIPLTGIWPGPLQNFSSAPTSYPSTGNHSNANLANPALPPEGSAPMLLDGVSEEYYLQMLREMNAFTEGGLTGLDDWAAQPDDFLMTGMPVMPSVVDWSSTATGAHGAQGTFGP